MPRDESRDVYIDESSIGFDYTSEETILSSDDFDGAIRYVPHAQMVEAEKRIEELEAELAERGVASRIIDNRRPLSEYERWISTDEKVKP
jgi:hypothetical protein